MVWWWPLHYWRTCFKNNALQGINTKATEFRSELAFKQHDITMPKEQSVILKIKKLFAKEKTLQQNSVLDYKIDLYFSHPKLAGFDNWHMSCTCVHLLLLMYTWFWTCIRWHVCSFFLYDFLKVFQIFFKFFWFLVLF